MLELQIQERHVIGLPFRALELDCSIRNKSTREIALLEAWIKITTAGNRVVLDGFHLEQFHAPTGRATIKAGDQCPGKIVIPMPSVVLNDIEEERDAKDLEFPYIVPCSPCSH